MSYDRLILTFTFNNCHQPKRISGVCKGAVLRYVILINYRFGQFSSIIHNGKNHEDSAQDKEEASRASVLQVLHRQGTEAGPPKYKHL